MAKDPAFLFYPGDWLGGTMGFTFEQKGCYLELLVYQFNNGSFSEAQAKQVLSICFELAWPLLQRKFTLDNGLYYNARLKEEIEKRKSFTESRRSNGLKGKNKTSTSEAYAKHMESENENENTLSSSSLVLSSASLTPMFQLEYEDLKKDFLNSESWIVTLIRNNPKLKDGATVKKHMIEFCKVLSDANQYPITFKEASNRFSGYLKKIINAPQSGNSDILESKMKVY